MMKPPVVLGVLLVLVLTLVGCETVTQNSGVKPIETIVTTSGSDLNPESLVFRITWKSYSGRGEAIRKIVDKYNRESGSDYEVVLADGDEDLEAVKDALSPTGHTDIFLLPYRFVQYLGDTQNLYDLTDSFKSEAHYFYPALWQMGSIDGRVYGVPWLGHSMGLIYNRSILEKAGVEADTINSLEDLVEACERIEAATDAKGIGLVGADHNDISWMVNQFIYGFGGSLVSPDGAKVAINSPESRQALLFYRDVLGGLAQSTWLNDTGVEVMAHFRAEKIAFEIQGLWGITDIWKAGRPFETGVIPLDRIGLYPEVGPMMLALNPSLDDDRYAAAVSFIQFMISTQAQEMIMDGEYSPEHDTHYPFRLPVRKDMIESPIFQQYPEFSLFLTGFSQPSVDVPVPQWQAVKDKLYDVGLNRLMTGQMTVDDFLQQIEQEGNALLNGDLEGSTNGN